MIGFAISLTKHVEGFSPRMLVDNDNSGFWKEICCETKENKEKRINDQLPIVDWEVRFIEETLPDAVEKLCEYVLYAHPDDDFSKWYRQFKESVQVKTA